MATSDTHVIRRTLMHEARKPRGAEALTGGRGTRTEFGRRSFLALQALVLRLHENHPATRQEIDQVLRRYWPEALACER